MVTFQPGQLIIQPQTRRMWRLVEPAPPDSMSGRRRWHIAVVDPGTVSDRRIGEMTTSSEQWMIIHCENYEPPKIEPPIGNGTQRCAFQILDGVVAQDVFTTAEDAIDFFALHLKANDGLGMGLWWGCDGWTHSPDMTVTMVDGELIWADS